MDFWIELIKDVIGVVCVFCIPVVLVFWWIALGGTY